MKKTVNTQEMILSCPEEFHEADETELEDLYFSRGSGPVLLWPEKHIILSVTEKKAPLFPAMKGIMKSSENDLQRKMKKYGYHCENMSLKHIRESEAAEISYTYELQGRKMSGSACIFKRKGILCILHRDTPDDLKEENREVLDEILDSIRWKEK